MDGYTSYFTPRLKCGYRLTDDDRLQAVVMVDGEPVWLGLPTTEPLDAITDACWAMGRVKPPRTKSEIMREIAERQGWPVVDIKLSECDAADLRGLPTC